MSSIQERSHLSRIFIWCGAIAIALVISGPVAWSVITSFKLESRAVTFPPMFWPSPFTISNYVKVITFSSFQSDLFNSIVYSGGAVALSLLVGIPAGYAATRFQFRGKGIVMLIILATSMVPGVVLLVPTYILLDYLGLLNNRIIMILVMANRLIPQTVWFIQNFIQAVPIEIEEAAFVDGARRTQIVRLLILPLIKPGIAAVAVIGVITCWNDYVTVAVYAPDVARRTLQVTLVNQVFDSAGLSWSFFMAYAIVSSIPVVALFMLAQRWFVAGLTAGTVKG
jgi:multiple sugar transport system permease protein